MFQDCLNLEVGGTDLIFQISLAPSSVEANVPPNKQLRTIS